MFAKEQKRVLIEILERALTRRDVKKGFSTFDEAFLAGLQLSPADPLDFELLILLAQWVDLGYRTARLFEQQLSAFRGFDQTTVGASPYFRLKLAEGFQMLANQQPVRAAHLFSAVLETGELLLTPSLLFVTHFWKGRAHRQAGDFTQALAEVHQARDIAEAMNADEMAAVAKIHESWLMFHKGERNLAFDLLGEAERVLRPTGHALSLGNISAARGRFMRRSGQYSKALGYFEHAISLYQDQYPSHPNLARALVNAAYVKRLIVLESRSRKGERTTAASHAKLLHITHEAMELLQRAEQIYSQYPHQPGIGSLLINYGHLQLDSGDIASAQAQADRAYGTGEENHDPILMTRARVLQAYVLMATSDEGLDGPPGPLTPIQRAVQFADEAVKLAVGSQNRRLLAAAYITRGLTACDVSAPDWPLAMECASQAESLIGSEDHDHLTSELGLLKKKVAQSQNADDVLRSWMVGEFRGKTFQEIEEDFAAMVIPKAWVRCNRNVARVAQELSISPKKVRRILRKARLTEGSKFDSDSAGSPVGHA